MIKIEVTGNSLAEVSDKLLAIGASLQRTASYEADNAAREALQAKRDAARGATAEEAAHSEEKATVGTEAAKRTRKAKGNGASTADGTGSTTTTEVAAEAEIPTEAATVSEEPEKPLNFDTEVAPLVLKLVQTKGPEAIKAILDQFGVARASQIDPSRFGELVALVQDAL